MIRTTMGLPSRSQGALLAFFISKHGTLDEHSKTKTVAAGLITTCWAPSNQSSLSERSPQCKTLSIYLYNQHLCRLSWGKEYWTCLQVSDNMIFWEHISSHLLRPPFLQVSSGDFNIFRLLGQRCLWSASYCMNKDAPPNTVGSRGYGSNLVPPKVGRL